MTELTLDQKITYCNYYVLSDSWEFICLNFKLYTIAINEIDTMSYGYVAQLEEEFKNLFPELHEMIIQVGKEQDFRFKWGDAWETTQEKGGLLEKQK